MVRLIIRECIFFTGLFATLAGVIPLLMQVPSYFAIFAMCSLPFLIWGAALSYSVAFKKAEPLAIQFMLAMANRMSRFQSTRPAAQFVAARLKEFVFNN